MTERSATSIDLNGYTLELIPRDRCAAPRAALAVLNGHAHRDRPPFQLGSRPALPRVVKRGRRPVGVQDPAPHRLPLLASPGTVAAVKTPCYAGTEPALVSPPFASSPPHVAASALSPPRRRRLGSFPSSLPPHPQSRPFPAPCLPSS